jgi:hypothetical protein
MLRVARLPKVRAEIQAAFLPIWIEMKMLPNRVGDRKALAAALRILFPDQSGGAVMHLYRGASALERRHHRYGFSWTKEIDRARDFADHWRRTEKGGVILETFAASNAVLLEREQDDGYYPEAEVVLDPFKLERVRVVERLPSLFL